MKVVATMGLWINQQDEDGKDRPPLIYHKGNEYDISEELYNEKTFAFKAVPIEAAAEGMDAEHREAIAELKEVRAGYGLRSYKREQLDDMARSVGITAPEELPNKDAVADAIIARAEEE